MTYTALKNKISACTTSSTVIIYPPFTRLMLEVMSKQSLKNTNGENISIYPLVHQFCLHPPFTRLMLQVMSSSTKWTNVMRDSNKNTKEQNLSICSTTSSVLSSSTLYSVDASGNDQCP